MRDKRKRGSYIRGTALSGERQNLLAVQVSSQLPLVSLANIDSSIDLFI
jgi:hypothetical protein